MKNPITLVVIDPQVDFVSGSLAVSSAHEAMNYLAQWGLEHIEEIEGVVFTSDQHPFDHCSFTSQGGVWPSHCVRYTEGAAITPELLPLVHEVYRRHIPFCMVEKATTPERDSYSAFSETVPSAIEQAQRIVLAGIAGDYCVLESLKDLIRHGYTERITLLSAGIAHIDDGSTLRDFVAATPALQTI
ncbi:isochorismatase family protein [Porphyromonas endodontalis]|uniref:isochorismatase family protein n=1 Tax=Porphyromonas endodontalis TaxID=28124 RepID=UPI0028EE96C3|nr:isochorismatase family protein [Porphyromonas endodontalis]